MDEGTMRRLKELYSLYEELLDARKELNDQIKDVFEEAKTLTSLKTPLIRSAFKFLHKKNEEGTDELDDIVTIVEGIE